MQPIIPPLKPGDTGKAAVNLVAAIRLIVAQGVIKTFEAPNVPTLKELQTLDGHADVEGQQGRYAERAAKLVEYFQIQQGLGEGLKGQVESKTADALNRVLKKLGALDILVPPAPGELVVKGRVTTASGAPAAGLLVKARDRDLRTFQHLGSPVSTDADGTFRIQYAATEFARADKANADLVVSVFATGASTETDRPLVESATLFDAPPVSEIDLQVPDTDSLIEFEHVRELVAPLLVGQGEGLAPSASLVSTDLLPHEVNADDAAFIQRETGLDPVVVTVWAEAARAQRDALRRLPPEDLAGHGALLNTLGWPFFFALLRARLAAELDGLLLRTPSDWREALSTGATLRRVRPIDVSLVKQLVDAMLVLQRLARLDAVRNPGSKLAQVVAASPVALPTSAAQQILQIEVEGGLDEPDRFLVVAQAHPELRPGVNAFVRTLRVHQLTGGDLQMTGLLSGRLDGEDHSIEPLAALSRREWDEVADSGATGGREAAAMRAADMQLRVERMHPVTALISRFNDGSVKLVDPELGELVSQVKLHTDAADAFLRNIRPAPGDGPAISGKAADTLKNLGRFSRSGLTFEGAATLMNAGIKSPGAAITYGSDVFRQQLGWLYPPQQITMFGNQLGAANNTALAFVAEGLTILQLGQLFGLGAASPPEEVRENLPTLRGLFGDLDECVCRPCESVLGLPAYLVDLLNLVATVPYATTSGGVAGLEVNPGATLTNDALSGDQKKVTTGQGVLRQRRPDLFKLDLSCQNAEEEVQYIDLALAVLEVAISPARVDSDSALRAAAYPWSLPFDRHDAELRALTPRLGLSRQVQLTLDASAPDVELAACALGIALRQGDDKIAEWNLLTEARTSGELWAAWGLNLSAGQATVADPASGAQRTGTPPEVLGWASMLMQRTGLELDALQAVLATRYVGGLSLSNHEQCKTSEMQLSSRTEADFDRIHRFVRLLLKLPRWNAALLDSALVACNAAGTAPASLQINADVLKALAAAERARATLDLQPQDLLALRMPLAEIRLGGNAASTLQKHAYPWLEPISQPVKRITDSLDHLSASLGIGGRELALLVTPKAGKGAMRDQVEDVVNVDNLVWLYRHAVLSRSLGISIQELVRLQMLTRIEPFEGAPASKPLDPATGFKRLIAIEEACQTIARSGLSIYMVAAASVPASELQELVAGAGVPMQSVEHFTTTLSSIQAALRDVSGTWRAESEQELIAVLAQEMEQSDAARIISSMRLAANAAPGTAWIIDAQALEALTGGTTPRRLGEMRPLATDAQAALWLSAAAAGATPMKLEARLEAIRQVLADRLRERRLIAAVQSATSLDSGMVVNLLQGELEVDPVAGSTQPRTAAAVMLDSSFWDGETTPAVSPPVRAALDDWLHRFDRLMSLLDFLKAFPGIDALLPHIAWHSTATTAGGANWSKLLASQVATKDAPTPLWADWQELLDLIWLCQLDQVSVPVLHAVLKRLAGGTGPVLANELDEFAQRLKVPGVQLLAFAGQLGEPVNRQQLRTPNVLRRLVLLVQHLQPSGADPTLAQLLRNASNTSVAAAAARKLLIAKLGGSEDTPALQKIDDIVRGQRRDAAVAWLVQTNGLRNADDLYEQFLIDPQVQPCLRTTRILAAITAVQLFVQRMLHGVEPGLVPGDELKRRWVWMRNYRVWEANRKAFLFPENWLFPELRDDKSSSFRQLESALGKGELTAESAIQAFDQFLDDAVLVSQVRALGLFADTAASPLQSTVGARRTVYVIGRTANPPYLYFWRRCSDFGGPGMEWSPWQRIELDIEGDHVMPFVIGRQLHVAWPKFERVPSKTADVDDKWRVSLAWSHYNGSVWSRVSASRGTDEDAVELEKIPFGDERSGFAFRCWVDQQRTQASVQVFGLSKNSNTALVKELAPEDLQTTLTAPNLMYFALGVPRMVALVSNGWNVFEAAFPDLYLPMLEAWSVSDYNNQPPDRDVRDPFYSALDIFHGSNGHLETHIRLKKDLKHVQDWIVEAEPKTRLGAFIQAYYDYESRSGDHWRYRNFVDQVHFHCHGRRIRFRVWARVTVGGVTDLKELDRNNGSFQVRIGSVTHHAVPGQELTLDPEMGDGPELTCSLTWTNVNLASGAETLKAVPVGINALQTVHFEIDATQVADLPSHGIVVQRDFIEVATFCIDRRGTVSPRAGSKQPLEVAVRDVEPWMNGFRETSTGTALTVDRPGNPGAQVFNLCSPVDRFWVVGASTNGVRYEMPSLWHFRELDGACYIDFESGAAMRLYPDVPQSAPKAWQSWAEKRELPSNLAQLDSGGAEFLPSRGPSFANALPAVVSSGLAAFDSRLPGACYSWEIFLHAPLAIADQLSKQQRFEAAEQWLRCVFDPTSGQAASDPRRFLRFRVFRELDMSNTVSRQLTLLARAAGSTATSAELVEVRHLVEKWLELPFRPFVVARRRPIAFLWRTLFAYLDNLLAWADSLYRRDGREAIGEATLLYVLASRILGRRPRIQAKAPARAPKAYDDIQGKWDEFANSWIDALPEVLQFGSTAPDKTSAVGSASGHLFFCTPFNDKLFTYWNLVESRLFNIRHCRNIEGITRDLPLTDPPIDPELLIRATAAGLDMGAVIAGLYAPAPTHRFALLAARAAELANDARALGNALLSALEKRDAEQLSLLRSANELALLERTKALRELQLKESRQNLEALRGTRTLTGARFEQFQRLLGRKDVKLPAEQERLGEESMLGREADGGSSEASRLGLIDQEAKHIEYLGHAFGWNVAAGVMKGVAGAAHVSAGVAHALPQGVGTTVGHALNAVGTGVSTIGEMFDLVSRGWQHGANQESLMASNFRRRDEWAFQSNQALKEMRQIDRQILANQIRISLAQNELDNHAAQIEQAQAVDEFMRDKYTNEQLYEWMVTQISGVHWNAYRMALDLARRAEQSARRELGASSLRVIGNDYWDSFRSGLLAGERLYQDIKRLEIAYLEQNRREYELTQHVSLHRLDPLAMLKLVKGGTCEFGIPEWLFDRDTPGHYMRRIKSASLSIPCVVGPYASVNCKLTLLRSETRLSNEFAEGYAKATNGDDARFDVRYGASEAIVTSSGRDDSGLFEAAGRDERYLPFESAGAISWWRLEIPRETMQFDPDTISDVILHLRYTARDGGDELRDRAKGQFASSAQAARRPGRQMVLLSCRRDFDSAWTAATVGSDSLRVKIDTGLLPYWMTALGMSIRKVSTLPLPLRDPADDSSYMPSQRWPTPGDGTSIGLTETGTGTANLGPVPAKTVDVLLVLLAGHS